MLAEGQQVIAGRSGGRGGDLPGLPVPDAAAGEARIVQARADPGIMSRWT
jgi:hypothetical protein